MGKKDRKDKDKAPKEGKKAAKEGLVERNGALSKKFKTILREVFDRFDADKDGALSHAEFSAFAKVAGHGDNVSSEEFAQLNMFSVDASGSLTRLGFEQMYLQQTNFEPADTWRDLTRLGYTADLEPREGAPAEPSAEELMSELRAALTDLKLKADNPLAHRRVGEALKAMGRDEAAEKSFQQAQALATGGSMSRAEEAVEPASLQPSTVEDQD